MKHIRLVENPRSTGCRWVWQEWNDWVMEREYPWCYTDNNTDDVLLKIIVGEEQ